MTEFAMNPADFRDALTTARAFTADPDGPETLRAVRVEPSPRPVTEEDTTFGVTGYVDVVATDRFTLSVETVPCYGGEPFALNIPLHIADQLLELPEPAIGAFTYISHDEGTVTISVNGGIGARGRYEAAVEFPDPDPVFVGWRATLARHDTAGRPPAPTMAFNPVLLARAMNAITDRYGDTATTLTFRGPLQSVLIEIHALKIIVMPVRLPQTNEPAGDRRVVDFAAITRT